MTSNQDYEETVYSPSPSTILPENTIPNYSVMIKYEPVDPTLILENPRDEFGEVFTDHPVDEKLGSMLVEILLQYQALSTLNLNMAIQNVKNNLTLNQLHHAEVYDLLDTFFLNVAEVGKIDSSLISVDNIPLFVSKHALHADIAQKLKDLQEDLKKLRLVTARQVEEKKLLVPPVNSFLGGDSGKKNKNHKKFGLSDEPSDHVEDHNAADLDPEISGSTKTGETKKLKKLKNKMAKK